MASNRDKLRAMSKKNLEEQKQMVEQPTLVTGVVNQLNANITEETNEPVSNQDEVLQEEVAEPVEEVTPQPEEELIVMLETPIEEKTPTEKKADKPPVPKKSSPKKEKKAAEKPKTEYTGREVTVTLLLSEEVNEFLTYKSIELRIPAKKFFKDLMINEIENGVLVEDALTKSYRKVQHDTVKRSIPVNEDLKEAIKETAIKYHMKYTPFMAYVIDKARLASMETTK